LKGESLFICKTHSSFNLLFQKKTVSSFHGGRVTHSGSLEKQN